VTDLFERYRSFIATRLRSLGVPESLVDDAGQDVYLVAFRRIGDFRGEAHVKTWLSAIAQHVASNYRRSERRRSARMLDGSLDEIDPISAPGTRPADDPLEWTARREAAALLDRLLGAIGDRTRTLFVMVAVEGMTVGEAARVLGMNANTAYSSLRVARPACMEAMMRSASLVL